MHFGRVWYKEKLWGVFWGWGCVPGYTQGDRGTPPYHDTRLRSGPEFLTVNPSLPSHTQIFSYKNPYYSYMGKIVILEVLLVSVH